MKSNILNGEILEIHFFLSQGKHKDICYYYLSYIVHEAPSQYNKKK